jgi:hypothetical protein
LAGQAWVEKQSPLYEPLLWPTGAWRRDAFLPRVWHLAAVSLWWDAGRAFYVSFAQTPRVCWKGVSALSAKVAVKVAWMIEVVLNVNCQFLIFFRIYS